MFKSGFLLLFLLCNGVFSATVKVKVDQGWLEGQVLETSTGMGNYNSFKGIPYAAPPLGNLRFRAPQPPYKWEGIRNASEHGSVCVQYKTITSQIIIGNEDCLFLNVYSPNLTPTTLLPVMFFIHGGYFIVGSGNDDEYGPGFLMAYDVVLVTINYRLDTLGFFCLDTEEVPGNAALKDQIAALKWVQRNIKNFGGDPNRVTVFGQSVGGSSVSFHIVSPLAKGLFQRAIAMSGGIFNDWNIEFQPRRRAFALGRKLGIDTKDSSELLEYLRGVPAKDLIRVRPNVLLSDQASSSVLTTIYFTPVVEKKFNNGDAQYLTEYPRVLLCKRQVNQVDFLTGHTAQEGLRATALVDTNIFKYYPIYKELLVPLLISYNRSPTKILRLADMIQSFYFKNQSISLEVVKDFVTYYSYSHFVYPIHAYIEKLPKFASTRRFFYEFSIYSTRNVFSKPGAMKFGIEQATHNDDLPYLFDGSSFNLTVDVYGQAFKYVQLMCTLFTNFAKNGTPTPDNSLGLVWPEYDPYRSAVIIGEMGQLSPINVSYSPNTSVGFWHQLYLSTGINL